MEDTQWNIKGTFFYPAMAQMKDKGGFPVKGTFLYKVITEDLQTWIAPWRMYAAAYTLLLAGVLICGSLLILMAPHGPKPAWLSYFPLWGFLIAFCVSWPLAMNSTSPEDIVLKTARLLELDPITMCGYTEQGLKERARHLLYKIAAEHQERQRKYQIFEPEFQETYQHYSECHCWFQHMRLIPKDCNWGPYFNQTATLTF